jgi:DNA-binding transcriptional MerR regulator
MAAMTEYRIDDLARASGTTTRNIRGYQERGLLPQPLRRGRVAIYTDRHLKKLRAINKLLGNGFQIKHIATFLTNPGARVGEALDLAELLDESWATDPRIEISREGLEGRLGTLDEATLVDLVEAGVLVGTDDPDRYEAVDPHIIDNLAQLVERGVPLSTLIRVHADFTRKLDDAAGILIRTAHEEIVRRRGPGWFPTADDEIAWATDLVATMRQVGTANAHAALDRSLDAALQNELRLHEAAAQERDQSTPQ